MIRKRYPSPGWLGREFACPECGFVVEFELKDINERKIKPRQEEGRWAVWVPCEICGPMRTFVEVKPE